MFGSSRALRAAAAAGAAVAMVATIVPGANAAQRGDYSNPDYVRYELDQAARTTERQGYHWETAEYGLASLGAFNGSFLGGIGRQVRDLTEGRIYAGVGQLVPGGNVGDPQRYEEFEARSHTVEFLNHEGTNLVGRFWPCDSEAGPTPSEGPCPLVVVTTGSIQVTQLMYGWLAAHLQDHGYTVFTFDVRGQGESESTIHPEGNPPPQPANPQDGPNFYNGTVEAMRYALGRAHEFAIDPSRIGLVGHSLGASAISVVQQCSDAYPDRMVGDDDLPDACGGERFPILAVVAYDSLSSGVVPVAPAFDHRADGYFVNWVPTTEAPEATERVTEGSAFAAWKAAGVETMSVTVRAGMHTEWSQIPYIVSATRYGVPQSQHFSLAWFDRHMKADPTAMARLIDVVPAEPDGQHLDHRASLMSVKYASAAFLTDSEGTVVFDEPDLRAYARSIAPDSVVAIGDWAGIADEVEYGVGQPRGAVHEALFPAG